MRRRAWLSRCRGIRCCSPQARGFQLGRGGPGHGAPSQLSGHQTLRHADWVSRPGPSSEAPLCWERQSCRQQPATAPPRGSTARRARPRAPKELTGVEKAQRSRPKHQDAGRAFTGAPARSTIPFLELHSRRFTHRPWGGYRGQCWISFPPPSFRGCLPCRPSALSAGSTARLLPPAATRRQPPSTSCRQARRYKTPLGGNI